MQTSETAVTNGNTHISTGATAVLAAIISKAGKLLERNWHRKKKKKKDRAERESRLLCQTELWWKARGEINFLEACHLLAFSNLGKEKIEQIILQELGTFRLWMKRRYYLVHTLAPLLRGVFPWAVGPNEATCQSWAPRRRIMKESSNIIGEVKSADDCGPRRELHARGILSSSHKRRNLQKIKLFFLFFLKMSTWTFCATVS